MTEGQGEKAAGSLKRRLDLLIKQDPEMETFGASGYGECHQFQLGEPLTEEAIAEFEASYAVRLPEEYRDFLKYVGNGGAAPGYGLEPLFSAVPTDGGRRGRRYLSTPFKHTQAVGSDPKQEHLLEAEYEGYFPGCLYLADHGCGIHDFLIVSGPCRGQVWTDGTCDDHGVWPTSLNFNSWYSDWLDQSFLQLYSKKLARSQYVQFAAPSPERFGQFLTILDRLKADERSGGLEVDDSVYLAYFDEKAKEYFWFPSETERRLWNERRGAIWNATPPEKRWGNPALEFPKEFPHMIAGLRNAKIQFGECVMIGDEQAKLSYFEPGNVFWPAESVLSLVESFGFTLLKTGDGRGPRPEPRSRND
ncbi:MAG: SMI1/KNR4 family protein [Capsulimonas sp.]|uniref:SMI1/KNR4 family protein n=1 Tax=Capsulimonas sp. TaxID=2494211 RepID=UPI003267EA65